MADPAGLTPAQLAALKKAGWMAPQDRAELPGHPGFFVKAWKPPEGSEYHRSLPQEQSSYDRWLLSRQQRGAKLNATDAAQAGQVTPATAVAFQQEQAASRAAAQPWALPQGSAYAARKDLPQDQSSYQGWLIRHEGEGLNAADAAAAKVIPTEFRAEDAKDNAKYQAALARDKQAAASAAIQQTAQRSAAAVSPPAATGITGGIGAAAAPPAPPMVVAAPASAVAPAPPLPPGAGAPAPAPSATPPTAAAEPAAVTPTAAPAPTIYDQLAKWWSS